MDQRPLTRNTHTEQIAQSCLKVLDRFRPEQWPHVEQLFLSQGFTHIGQTELLYLLEVAALPLVTQAPLEGLTVRRTVGMNGTRLAAERDGEHIGYIEVDVSVSERNNRQAGVADIGNLVVAETHRRAGIASWLLSQAADWLRLNDIDQLVAYAWPDQTDRIAFLDRVGFRCLVVTKRGWERLPMRQDRGNESSATIAGGGDAETLPSRNDDQ